MKESPIIFNTPMVQAILDGRKTQTRRVVKPQPTTEYIGSFGEINKAFGHAFFGEKGWRTCPYGQIGNRLWVRETFAVVGFYDKLTYRAEGIKSPIGGFHFKWKPSIHMPKKYARIWLEITDIKSERLQQISEDDAKAEGVEYQYPRKSEATYKDYQLRTLNGCLTARESFMTLWDFVNRKKHPWESNPWVWVIKFKIC